MTTGRAQVNVITNDMTDSNNWESRKFGSSICHGGINRSYPWWQHVLLTALQVYLKMWCLVYFLNNIYPVIIRPTGRSYQISYDGFVSHAVSFDYNKHILESTRDVRPVVVNRSESKMTFKSMYVCPHPQSKFLRWPECIFPNHRSPNWKKGVVRTLRCEQTCRLNFQLKETSTYQPSTTYSNLLISLPFPYNFSNSN